MKLMPMTIWIIGVCLALVILSIGFFQFYSPRTKEAQYNRELAGKLQTEAAKLPAMRKKVEEAIAMRVQAVNAWTDIVNEKTPPPNLHRGGINMGVPRYQLVRDVIDFRNSIQIAVNRQMRKGGIKVIAAPVVPAFPDDPGTIIEEGFGYTKHGFPVKVYDFGQVTVSGTWPQIKEHVESWTRMPNYLAVTDGLTLSGTAPTLTATYSLSMVMYLRYDQIFPPVPTGTGGAPATPGSTGSNPGTPSVPGRGPAF